VECVERRRRREEFDDDDDDAFVVTARVAPESVISRRQRC